MRAFDAGKPFNRVLADERVDGEWVPVFSETFLYAHLGKDDARFVLAIADEYIRLIRKLGVDRVRELLEETRE